MTLILCMLLSGSRGIHHPDDDHFLSVPAIDAVRQFFDSVQVCLERQRQSAGEPGSFEVCRSSNDYSNNYSEESQCAAEDLHHQDLDEQRRVLSV